MSEVTIDAAGLDCPLPVINTRKVLLETPEQIVYVLVSDPAQAENVADMARNLGWDSRVISRDATQIKLELTHSGEPTTQAAATGEEPAASCGLPTKVTVLMASDRIGAGDNQLGRILAAGFIKTLKELTPLPHAVIFLNSGVYMCTESGQLVGELKLLEAAGVKLMACGTCLDYFDLKDKLAIGKVSNMFEIASLLVSSDRVVRP